VVCFSGTVTFGTVVEHAFYVNSFDQTHRSSQCKVDSEMGLMVLSHTGEMSARIAVRLAPRASRDAIGTIIAGELIVRVTAPPLDGRANEALTRLLAKRLHLGRNRVKIISGLHSRRKIVEIDGLTDEEVWRCL
jgi:uncharacterized protein (TIGR00251 family)